MKFRWITQPEKQAVSESATCVYLELTTRCNLSCAACPRHAAADLRQAHLSAPLFARILRSLRELPSLGRIVLMGYGEALCHPRIPEYLKELAALGADIILVTNGHLITRDFADLAASLPLMEIVISWDDDPGSGPPDLRRGSERFALERAIGLIRSSREASGSPDPLIGIETVIRKSNVTHLGSIIEFTREAGARRWYLSNLFPYDEKFGNDIAYVKEGPLSHDIGKLLKKELRELDIVLPVLTGDTARRCPFIEKGSLYISVSGNVSPCMELAYAHDAVYFGIPRRHYPYIAGSIKKRSVADIWNEPAFRRFRENFLYWDFPDCTSCYDPGRCYNRMDLREDCYGNAAPCGECLWARGIVLCP